MRTNVLAPMGMEEFSYLMADVDPGKLAAPQVVDEDGKPMTPDFFPYGRVHAPSAAPFSNVNDMARFAVGNMNQGNLDRARVLPASAYDEMCPQRRAQSDGEAP